MIYVIAGISLFFIIIGFAVTEQNANIFLSGYNTMNEADKKKVALKAYILFFKKFHVFMGSTFLIIGVALTTLIHEDAGGIFLSTYPIIAYIYFLAASAKFFKGRSPKQNKIGISLLIGALIFVIILLGYGYMENNIVIQDEKIVIKGMYGATIHQDNLKSIELTNTLPKATFKTNGFALANIQKGYFKTSSGEVVKLIINTHEPPFLLLTTKEGKKIYYASKSQANIKVFEKIRHQLSSIKK